MASGECVVKINEVILEALNKSTGTPNANPAPPPAAPADADQPEWTGRKQAAPAKPDYSQKPGAYSSNPGNTATYNVPTGIPNPTATPPVTSAPQTQTAPDIGNVRPGDDKEPAQSAPVDTAYQDQLDKNIQQKQQAAVAANQANTPAQKAKQGLKNLGGALAKGVKGAVKGFNQSRDMNAARAAGGENLEYEFADAKKFIQQRGAVADMRNPQELQTAIQSWANSRYPSAKNSIDVSTVQPGNQRSIEDYITKMYSAAMSNRSMGQRATPAAGNTTTANTNNQQTSTLIDPNTNKPFVTQPAQTTQSTQSTAPAPDAHDAGDEKHDLAPGVEIIQQEPIIVKYKNKEYGLNDRGEWVHFGSTKVPHQSFQAFLDKQAGFQPVQESVDLGQVLWNKMKRSK